MPGHGNLTAGLCGNVCRRCREVRTLTRTQKGPTDAQGSGSWPWIPGWAGCRGPAGTWSGLWMRKRVARGLSSPYRRVCVSVCVCARTCVVRMHVCGTWMRVRVCDVGGVHLRMTVTQAWDRRAGLEPERSWCVLCLPTAAAEPPRGRCSRIRGDRIGGDRSGPGPAKRGAQLG